MLSSKEIHKPASMLLKSILIFSLFQLCFAIDCIKSTKDTPVGCYWFNATIDCRFYNETFTTATVEVWEWNFWENTYLASYPITRLPGSTWKGRFSFWQCVKETGSGDDYAEVFLKIVNFCNKFDRCRKPFEDYITVDANY